MAMWAGQRGDSPSGFEARSDASSFPPTFGAGNHHDAPPLRHNLPAQTTPFIGRQQLIEAVRDRLLRSDVRLLTLMGAGGTGKTRLALRAAADLVDHFEDGVFLVSLATLTDASLIASAIAQALGVTEVAGQPLLGSLKTSLKNKQLLLVLDNFEHLIEAAPLAADLLTASPRLKVLATSRVPLRLYGEHSLPVPPMALPDRSVVASSRDLLACESVKLFVERAAAAKPGFALTDENAPAVVEICHRLDGLPLAIELAAARVRALSLSTLLDRMARRLPLLTGGPRDVPARQQTLRNTIAWSFDLLAPNEQILFRRLAVFRGFTLESAEAVCGAAANPPGSTSIALPPPGIETLDGIASLVEKSLLKQEDLPDDQPWYPMLETVREFAQEQLAASGELEPIERRHALHYLKLAETAELELHGPQQAGWFIRIVQEHDNLRAALDCCVTRGYAQPAFRLALALWWFWMVSGHVSEGRQRFAALLARFPLRKVEGQRAIQRAKALEAAGTLAAIAGEFSQARALREEGLAIWRQLGDQAGAWSALEGLIMIATAQGDDAAARGYVQESLDIARVLDDPLMISHALYAAANVFHDQGDYARARELAEESLNLVRAQNFPRLIATASLSVALIALDQGDYDTAENAAGTSLTVFQEMGDERSFSLALARLGSIATAHGDFVAARERLQASLAIQQELADASGIAFVLERFAVLAVTQRAHERAMRLAGAAAALRETLGTPLAPRSQIKLDDQLAPARQALGEAAVSETWAEGRTMTMEATIAYALEPVVGADTPSPVAESGSRQETPEASNSLLLTAREQEVAALIARGCTNRAIAAELIITEGTAANHVAHILDKLGFASRSQIAAWAIQNEGTRRR